MGAEAAAINSCNFKWLTPMGCGGLSRPCDTRTRKGSGLAVIWLCDLASHNGSSARGAMAQPPASFWGQTLRGRLWPGCNTTDPFSGTGLSRYLERSAGSRCGAATGIHVCQAGANTAIKTPAHKLVTSHLRLVAKIAMGYRGYGLPIAE